MAQQETVEERQQREDEFGQEARHLADVVDGIDRDIDRQSENLLIPTIGPDSRSADVTLAAKKASLAQIRAARSSPYFGKVDYSEGKDADSVRTIYIGRHHMNIRDIPDRFIVNHNAPAAALYYNPAAGRYVVKGRRGEIIHEAKVYGTRSLKIEDSTLLEVEDILRLSMPGILTERLSRPSSDRLTDAIETLQPAQYAVLSRTDSPC